MKRARKAPDIPLSILRMSHLVSTPSGSAADRRLVNLKVPADLLDRAHVIARRLGVTKSATILALLNEGLAAAERRGLCADAGTAKRKRAARADHPLRSRLTARAAVSA